MTKKDLFVGLNYIDDQIIEEAQPTGESAVEDSNHHSSAQMSGSMKPLAVEQDIVGTCILHIAGNSLIQVTLGSISNSRMCL